MTTTRINHTGHDHPNTTAARTACRKAMAKATPVVTPVKKTPVIKFENITDDHCSSCGNTNPEDVANTYSGCCNKRVEVMGRCDIHCNHGC